MSSGPHPVAKSVITAVAVSWRVRVGELWVGANGALSGCLLGVLTIFFWF